MNSIASLRPFVPERHHPRFSISLRWETAAYGFDVRLSLAALGVLLIVIAAIGSGK
jgi:hypothetical protein